MPNQSRDLRELTDLRALQSMKCLSAEQAQSRAFDHLTSQKSARELAETKLSVSISDWNDFWHSDLNDAEWLNVLRQAISDRQDQLTLCEQDVELAKEALDESIKYHSQQRDCEVELSKRLRRKTRLFFDHRDELLRESIPPRQAVQS